MLSATLTRLTKLTNYLRKRGTMLDLSDKSLTQAQATPTVEQAPVVIAPTKIPVVSRRYRHYKGGLYRVEGLCTVEATQEIGVLYRSIDIHARQDVWFRPVSDFFAAMGTGGERFIEVREPNVGAMLRALPESLVPARVREQVLARYDEPGRFFHARWHPLDMFERAERAGITLSPEQAIAILFHDAVYVPGVPDGTNERLSVMLLRDTATLMGAFDVELSCRIIDDTATHQATCQESEIVLDLDLAALADDNTHFCVANELVWLENRHLLRDSEEPRRDFDTRRLKFLLNLAQRGPLFHTLLLGDLESQARENLENLRQAWVAQYSGEAA